VPEASDNFGIKIQGQVVNDWVAGLAPDVWHCVGAVAPTSLGGDANHFLLIFDSVPGPQLVHVGGLTMKIFESESDAAAAECGQEPGLIENDSAGDPWPKFDNYW
jgi:hypothetical protein